MIDTIVVCRPNQLREAAIVLSCLPRGPTTPLIVIDPAPTNTSDYGKLYQDYLRVRDERDEISGAALARAQQTPDIREKLQDLNRKVDEKVRALTPYRSWVKRNQFISELVRALEPRSAIYVFDRQADDLWFIEPTPRFHLSDERFPILPPIPESVEITNRNLGTLADEVWQRFRNEALSDGKRLRIDENDIAGYFTGLYRAFVQDCALYPQSGGPPGLPCADWNGTANEAVLIETAEDAARLLGVQYAARDHARLLVCTPPQIDEIDRARDGVQQMRDAETKNIFNTVRNFFDPDQTAAAIRGFEEAVTRAVPRDVVEQVGDLPLTAITDGVPYGFVKTKAADWSRKPIGHITGDIGLLLLTELFGPTLRHDIGFNVIFDPGFFETTETKDVIATLGARLAYSLVLSQNAASSQALNHLSGALPIELAFFNTHGSEHEIILSDMPFPAYKLVQRVTLRSRPIVFNNSCLSWTGVGKEFVRAGARGYVGTLWSVGAVDAASFARTVIAPVVNGNGVAHAIHESGIAPVNERAYIYVGTCSSRHNPLPAFEDSDPRARLTSCAGFLLEALWSWVSESPVSGIPFITSLSQDLFENANTVLANLDRQFPDPDIDRVDLLLLQLKIVAALVLRGDANPEVALQLFQQGQAMLSRVSVDEKIKATRRAKLFQYAARVPARIGPLDAAEAMLRESIAQAELGDETAGPQYLELSDVLSNAGRFDDAMAAARKALDVYSAEQPPNHVKMMLVYGRLGQISVRLQQFDDALKYAQSGFEKAALTDTLSERAPFKGDEVRAYFGLKRYQEALKAANEQLALARQAHDDGQELAAYGTLTRALIFTGDLDAAQKNATAGLRQARALGNMSEIGDFSRDLGEIKARAGEPLAALNRLSEAMLAFARCGNITKVRVSLAEATDLAQNIQTVEATQILLQTQISVIDSIPGMRSSLCTSVVKTLLALVDNFKLPALKPSLKALLGLAQRPDACEQRVFIARVLAMIVNYADGHKSDAESEAAALDALSDSGFGFCALLERLA